MSENITLRKIKGNGSTLTVEAIVTESDALVVETFRYDVPGDNPPAGVQQICITRQNLIDLNNAMAKQIRLKG